jgi:hypothetical protein
VSDEFQQMAAMNPVNQTHSLYVDAPTYWKLKQWQFSFIKIVLLNQDKKAPSGIRAGDERHCSEHNLTSMDDEDLKSALMRLLDMRPQV